jgi:Cu-processing system permease protein
VSHLKIIRTLARASVLETVRRKDLYVVLVLAGLMMVAGSLFRMMGARELETLMKDVSLSVVSFSSTVLCIVLSVRQLPEEIHRRTLRPLLARPIGRWHLILGKWAGAAAMSSIALVALVLIAWLNLAISRIPLGPILWQYVLLRVFALLVISAFTMALSLLLTSSAAATVSLLVFLGASTFGNTLLLLPDTASPVAVGILRSVFFLVPQVDLFDLQSKVTYDWGPIPLWTVAFLAAYAAGYTALFLGVAIYRFQRQPL